MVNNRFAGGCRLTGALARAVLLALAAAPARAQEAPPSWGPPVAVAPDDAALARAAVDRQIAAFRARDDAAAYAETAPNIRRRFPSPAAFMAMVRRDYGALLDDGATRFGGIRGVAATAVQAQSWSQSVALTTRDGHNWTAVYGLERQPDGGLRITNCVVVRAPDGAS